MGEYCGELEITSEMIDFGADALIWHGVIDVDLRMVVVDVLAAMGAAVTDQGFVFRKRTLSADHQRRKGD